MSFPLKFYVCVLISVDYRLEITGCDFKLSDCGYISKSCKLEVTNSDPKFPTISPPPARHREPARLGEAGGGRGKYLKERGTMGDKKALVPVEVIVRKILFLRGEKVLLDRDLAELYGVETRVLKQAVRRNIKRFPEDFMFELTKEELEDWRSQFVISKSDKMGLRYRPMAFTEQGVAMLSSVLNSDRAIEVNIAIMRAFVQLRKMISSNEDLEKKLKKLKRMIEKHDEDIGLIFEAIRELMTPPDTPPKKIGFET